jgi:hypothetical protein
MRPVGAEFNGPSAFQGTIPVIMLIMLRMTVSMSRMLMRRTGAEACAQSCSLRVVS